jgi:hypothetical protein
MAAKRAGASSQLLVWSLDTRYCRNNFGSMNSPKLYRYLRDEAAIKTIEARCFRVSRLTELNDPFEWRVGFDGAPPELEEILERQMEGFVEMASQSMGVICFSKNINDPVLWSHYTNVHRGIAFEVDVNVNANLVSDLHEVEYDKPPIVIPFQRYKQMTDNELRHEIRNLHKQKSASWHYEQECRLVIGLETCRPCGGSFLWDKMPPAFISGAIIGFRSSVGEQYLRQALDLNGFQHTRIFKAKRSLETYEIKLEAMTKSSPGVWRGWKTT